VGYQGGFCNSRALIPVILGMAIEVLSLRDGDDENAPQTGFVENWILLVVSSRLYWSRAIKGESVLSVLPGSAEMLYLGPFCHLILTAERSQNFSDFRYGDCSDIKQCLNFGAQSILTSANKEIR